MRISDWSSDVCSSDLSWPGSGTCPTPWPAWPCWPRSMPFWLRIFSCRVSPRPPQRLVGRAVKWGGHHGHRRYCKPRLRNLSDGIRRGGDRKTCPSRCIAAPPALRLASPDDLASVPRALSDGRPLPSDRRCDGGASDRSLVERADLAGDRKSVV